MPTNTYNWVPDDLVEVADEIRAWLQGRGYALKIEKVSDGFPFPPTFHCTRTKLERLLVEVLPDWQENRLQTWVAYAKTCKSELKICMGVSHDLVLSPTVIAKIRKAGVGVLRSGGGNTYFEIEPVDATMDVSLPSRASLPKETKVLLGAVYDHFEASRWREGFEEACKVFEKAAKRYLKKWVKTGRVRFVTTTGLVAYTNKKIDRFTLGQLGNAFEAIQAQNSSDRAIKRAIDSILKDRNNLTHDKWNLRTENRLRNNVGHHMWIITQALTETYN
jgi:hypothetical protein